VNWSIKHSTVKTNPGKSSFGLSPIGIGHLATFRDYLVVNNIDHNSEFSLLEQSLLKPIALYDQTIYPDDSENSGFDLDIHAVLYDSFRDSLLMLNHLGRLRFFDPATILHREKPVNLSVQADALWVGDAEYSLLANDCLISSSPGDYHVPGPAKTGVFVSSPLSTINPKAKPIKQTPTLEYAQYFADSGIVSALAVNKIGNLLTLAFGQDIIVVKLFKKSNGTLSLDSVLAEFKMNFYTRFLSFCGEDYIVAAGHNIQFEEDVYDPSSLKAGGYAVIDTTKKESLFNHQFDCDLAWGNGCLCLSSFNAEYNSFLSSAFGADKGDTIILGVDRQAGLWAWHCRSGRRKMLAAGAEIDSKAGFGIAHLSWYKRQLICGFNRDGSRLHVYNFDDQ